MHMTSQALAMESKFIAAGGHHARYSLRAAYDSAEQVREAQGSGSAGAIGKIIAWSLDNLAPDEIQELVKGLKNLADGAMDTPPPDGPALIQFKSKIAQDARIRRAGGYSNAAWADFAERYPDAAKVRCI